MRRSDGYMLVNLISAIQFISSIDANCLTINPLDYQMCAFDDVVIRRMCAASEERLREQGGKRYSIFCPVCCTAMYMGAL